jgi:hypothetical protein
MTGRRFRTVACCTSTYVAGEKSRVEGPRLVLVPKSTPVDRADSSRLDYRAKARGVTARYSPTSEVLPVPEGPSTR